MTALKLRNVVKRYGEITAVDDLSFTVESGEFFSVLGPSGCGKTTTLRCITGFEQPDEGSVELNGQAVTTAQPADRDVSMVFQGYALFPHMTVGENIEFGLKLQDISAETRAAKVAGILETVNLPGMQDREPEELSGGQQQRVALARALVLEPSVLALDEPLASLDRNLRQEMRYELKKIQNEMDVTTIYVTHNQQEAMALSDRMLVMDDGSAEQIGTPAEIYRDPANEFVAGFIGESNILNDVAVERDGITAGARVTANGATVAEGEATETARASVAIRPEDIQLNGTETGHLSGEVRTKTFHGNTMKYIIDVGGREIKAETTSSTDETYQVGDTVGVDWDPDGVKVLNS